MGLRRSLELTIFLVSSLALLSGFSLALFVAAICLAVIAVDTRNQMVKNHREETLIYIEKAALEEKRALLAETKLEANVKAIEASSLPWFPKSDKLEARYENEALDKLENPSFYADVVEGLGGLK